MMDETCTTPAAPDLFEGMTAISAVLDPVARAFNDRTVKTVFIDRARTEKKAREIAFLRHRAEELGFDLQMVRSEDLDALTSGKTHGGIVAICSDRTIPTLDDGMDSTVDFETVGDDTKEADNCVTVRDRDTMEQVRIPISELKSYIEKKIEF